MYMYVLRMCVCVCVCVCVYVCTTALKKYGECCCRVRSKGNAGIFSTGSGASNLKARLHGSPWLINTVESMKLNSTVERYCLHGSTNVNEAVDFKMAANEHVRDGVVVICDYLIKECQHILQKRNKRKKTTLVG